MNIMKIKYIFSGLLLLLMIVIRSAYSAEPDSGLLTSLVNEALKNNPQIQAAHSDWKASEYRVSQERSLPDPMARYTYFGENVETRVGPQKQKYGASQKIPFPGKLGLKGKAQQKQAAILKQRYEATRREIIKNVKFVYNDMYWIDRAIQVTEEEKIILESLESVAQRRYEANLTPQQDVIKVGLELSRLIDKLVVFKQHRKSLSAKLNSILNRPEGQEFVNTEVVSPSNFEYSLDELKEMAQDSRQELLAAALNIERAKYEKSLAGMDFLPDFTFGFDYIEVDKGHTAAYNDGQDAWMGTVAVNVPLWFGKQRAQLKEKESLLQARMSSYDNLKNNVIYEVEDLYFKISAYRDIISLYESALMPQAQQSFEAAKTAYETGRVDFLNWLDSERVLLQTRLAYYKSIVDYQKSIAYLERVIGREI